MTRDYSKPTDGLRVVIAGGVVAGLETMLALRALAEERVDVDLLAPDSHFWYRPLAVAEPFDLGRAEKFELAGVAAACSARFALASLASVDTDAHVARTAAGADFPYDVLVLAPGARPEPAFENAFTFRGPADSEGFRRLLEEVEAESARRLVFAVPNEAAWPLPLYELVLLTTARLRERGVEGFEVALVTPESRPLALFGAAASDAMERLLAARGVVVHAGNRSIGASGGVLSLSPTAEVPYDRLVALPRLRGEPIAGIQQNQHGFVSADLHGCVIGLDDVYAAGDITAFPVKQGGIAAQQADAVAEAIAERAGADVAPRPFRPVLRGLLLTGGRPTYLRTDVSGGSGDTSAVAADPLWWPPGKIVGRYLAPFLAEHVGITVSSAAPTPPGAVPVDVDLNGGS